MRDKDIERILQRAVGYDDTDLLKIGSELAESLSSEITDSEEEKGASMARGFVKELIRHGIDPKAINNLVKSAAAEAAVAEAAAAAAKTTPVNAPESASGEEKQIDPSVQAPSNIDKQPSKPNPNIPETATADQEDLEQLAALLGTDADPTKVTGRVEMTAEIAPEKDYVKPIIDLLVSMGVDPAVAEEVAKKAAQALQTSMSREEAKIKEQAVKDEAVSGDRPKDVQDVQAQVAEALDALEQAVVGPVADVAEATEEIAKAASEENALYEAALMMGLLYPGYGRSPWGWGYNPFGF